MIFMCNFVCWVLISSRFVIIKDGEIVRNPKNSDDNKILESENYVLINTNLLALCFAKAVDSMAYLQ